LVGGPRPGQRAKAAAFVLAAAGMVLITPQEGHAAGRHAAMAIDANTGDVLHAQSADEPRYPASLAKMMTLYIAFQEIEAGRLTYDSRIPISEAAASVAPSKLELQPGSDIALLDAMKALVTKSANDIAVAIAERIAGARRHSRG
jgi:D-alanyl-D-alanine carboxypeptidase